MTALVLPVVPGAVLGAFAGPADGWLAAGLITAVLVVAAVAGVVANRQERSAGRRP